MTDIRSTAAGKSISAYVILNKRGDHIATVRAHFGASRVSVEIWQSEAASDRCVAASGVEGDFTSQDSRASGYGYDKMTAALSGLWIDGHELTNHCAARLPVPRKGYFPSDYKPRKGYRLANFGQYDSTGKRVNSYDWRDKARAQLGDAAPWSEVMHLADTMRDAADLTGGYADCYRTSGLDYLSEIGYRVIGAI